ncbi:MAG: NAD-binding protein, partial [Actinomycetes bacterium]
MHIGVPTEIKPHETRTAVTPTLAATLTSHGHEVIVQRGAGAKSDLSDSEYQAAGATLVGTAEEVWARGDLIVKVKEPVTPEFALFRPDQAIFCFLHLAAARECQDALVDSGCTAIAFETVELDDGRLPLLAPMSAVAGRLACQFGAHFLTAPQGGRGLLLGGIDGAHPANTVVIGAGTAGCHAASVAVGLQADVTMIDRNPARLEQVTGNMSNAVDGLLGRTADAVDEARKG